MTIINKKIKIAVVTDDKKKVSRHFGRARYFAIFEIDDGAIIRREIRDNTECHTVEEYDYADDSYLHECGPYSQGRHENIAKTIEDCSILITRGMGYGAYEFFKSQGIEVIITDVFDAEDAVKRYIQGELRNLREKPD